jgi:hypothetical protein
MVCLVAGFELLLHTFDISHILTQFFSAMLVTCPLIFFLEGP